VWCEFFTIPKHIVALNWGFEYSGFCGGGGGLPFATAVETPATKAASMRTIMVSMDLKCNVASGERAQVIRIEPQRISERKRIL